MIVVTTETVTGYRITKVLGLARGSCIRAKHLGKDIGAALKSLVGGELQGYSQLLEESREDALSRLIEQAEKMEADAVVATRFVSSQIMTGASEFMAYGTAVKLEKET
ncbi:YbjQ family protein [Syntrophomonas erecta subsp. sporosyntropha]